MKDQENHFIQTNKHFKAHLYCLFALFTPKCSKEPFKQSYPPPLTHTTGKIILQQNNEKEK